MEHLDFDNFPETGIELVPMPAVANASYNYKYNGKELQEELGLNMTAMDFRQYDSAIGRFVGMDRLSELAYSITPYRFAYNNPNIFADPSGLIEENINGLAHCPTCPTTPAFKPYIDDPNKEYVYDPETNTVYEDIQIEEVLITNQDSEGQTNFQFDFSFLQDKSFNRGKSIFNATTTKLSTGSNIIQSISERQIIKKLQNGGSGVEAVTDWRSLDKLRKLNKGFQKVGYVGFAIDGAQYADKVINGKAKNSDHIRMVITTGLTFLAISNPIGIVAVGAYGIFDAYYGDEVWKETGIDD